MGRLTGTNSELNVLMLGYGTAWWNVTGITTRSKAFGKSVLMTTAVSKLVCTPNPGPIN